MISKRDFERKTGKFVKALAALIEQADCDLRVANAQRQYALFWVEYNRRCRYWRQRNRRRSQCL